MYCFTGVHFPHATVHRLPTCPPPEKVRVTHPPSTARRERRVRWALPKLLTRHGVEEWLAALPSDVSEVTFHLGEDGARSGPGATESLQAAICLLQRRDVRTVLTYPSATFTDSARVQQLMAAETETDGTPAERTLAYRPLGLILAQLCERTQDEPADTSIRELQAGAVTANGNLFGHGHERAIAVIGATDFRTKRRDSEKDRQSKLETRVLDLLGTSVYHPSRDGNPLMVELLEFVYQATENTFDHARRNLEGGVISQVRMVSLSRHKIGTGAGSVPLESHFPNPSSALRDYVERAQRRVAAEGKDPERLQLWSVSVADGGVGIAAKMHSGLDIYEGDLGHEYKLVQEAVLPEGTTKPLGEPGRGRGLVKMMRATHRLGGFFEIRSGRLALWRTYLEVDGRSEPNPNFKDRQSSAFNLHGENDEQIAVAGTVVSVLFPAFDLGPNASPPRSRA